MPLIHYENPPIVSTIGCSLQLPVAANGEELRKRIVKMEQTVQEWHRGVLSPDSMLHESKDWHNYEHVPFKISRTVAVTFKKVPPLPPRQIELDE